MFPLQIRLGVLNAFSVYHTFSCWWDYLDTTLSKLEKHLVLKGKKGFLQVQIDDWWLMTEPGSKTFLSRQSDG
jgi:hypothetical protein